MIWIGSSAAVFLVAGLVVSIKIGGGDNLHNLDLLLVFVVLAAALAVRQIAARGQLRLKAWSPAGCAILIVGVLLPVLQVIRSGDRLTSPPAAVSQARLEQLRAAVDSAGAYGPVLFIDQRQLLTFGLVESVPTVLDYEKIEMRDRAMAGDDAYFEPFYADLRAHRFSLIVSDPLPVVWRGSLSSFGEENDAWVRYVTIPILESYEPVLRMDDVGVWILGPKMEPGVDPIAGQPGHLPAAMVAR